MDEGTLARVVGPNLALRLIRPEDAAYVYTLRNEPAYNRHLSEVRGTIEDQRRWIESYKTRESNGRVCYSVIERKDSVVCGVVRLYDICQDGFNWGSWILDHNKPRKAALESAVLSFGVGFELLGLERAFVNVRAQNERALAFYLRLDMTQIDRTEQDVYLVYLRARYEADRDGFSALLVAAARDAELPQ